MRKTPIAQPQEAKARKAKKSARVELRVTAAAKRVIDRAVSISGLTPGDLAYGAARRVIDDHERFVLRDADREAFFRAVLNPRPPNARLLRAAQRYRAATRTS
jgi:uncharacterized protein (DUF1778 family)